MGPFRIEQTPASGSELRNAVFRKPLGEGGNCPSPRDIGDSRIAVSQLPAQPLSECRLACPIDPQKCRAEALSGPMPWRCNSCGA